jgi:hypothetical protein
MKGADIQRSPIVATLLAIYSSGEPYAGEPTVPPDAPSLKMEGPKVEPVGVVVEKPKVDTVVEKPTKAIVVRDNDAALIPYPWEITTTKFRNLPPSKEGGSGGTMGSPEEYQL